MIVWITGVKQSIGLEGASAPAILVGEASMAIQSSNHRLATFNLRWLICSTITAFNHIPRVIGFDGVLSCDSV